MEVFVNFLVLFCIVGLMVDVVLFCCFVGIYVSIIEFEKDDGYNYYVEYVVIVLSLRGWNYGIFGIDDCRFLFLLFLRLFFFGFFVLYFDEGIWVVDWVFVVFYLLKLVVVLRICYVCFLNLCNLC